MIAISKQRIYAFLLILGASILVFRTLRLMFFEQGLEILVLWVIILTIVELNDLIHENKSAPNA